MKWGGTAAGNITNNSIEVWIALLNSENSWIVILPLLAIATIGLYVILRWAGK